MTVLTQRDTAYLCWRRQRRLEESKKMAYVPAPIVVPGEWVRFRWSTTAGLSMGAESYGRVLDPGPLTRPRNLLGLLGPKGEATPFEFKVRVETLNDGPCFVDAYWVRKLHPLEKLALSSPDEGKDPS